MSVTTVSWLALVTSFPLISSRKSPFLLVFNRRHHSMGHFEAHWYNKSDKETETV
jgi:hypothetical protein